MHPLGTQTSSGDSRTAKTQVELAQNLTSIQERLSAVKDLLAPIGLVYAVLILFAVGHFNPTTVQEIVRRQGVVNTVLGTVVGSFRAVASLVMILAAAALWSKSIERKPQRVAVLFVLVAASILVPATALALAAAAVLLLILGSFLRATARTGTRREKMSNALPFVCVGVALWLMMSPLLQVLSAPWLPLERLDLTTGTFERGFVLGDHEGRLSVLRSDTRTVIWIDTTAVAARRLCEPQRKLYFLDGRSLLEILSNSPRYACDRPASDAEVATSLSPTTPDSAAIITSDSTSSTVDSATVDSTIGGTSTISTAPASATAPVTSTSADSPPTSDDTSEPTTTINTPTTGASSNGSATTAAAPVPTSTLAPSTTTEPEPCAASRDRDLITEEFERSAEVSSNRFLPAARC